MRDPSQGTRGDRRRIELATHDIRVAVDSLVENETINSVSSGDGKNPVAQTSTGDDPTVLEAYGFASRPSGTGTAIVVAPGGEQTDRVAMCVGSPSGRPATDGGDVAVWTGGGHSVFLDDDGDLIITARPGSSVVINVDTGQTVKGGGPASVKVLKAQDSQDHIAAALAYGAANAGIQDGGALALTFAAQYINGTAVVPPAIPGNGLVNAAATEKLEGE